ncbi:MAG: hypothetical protein JXR70_19680 [Spirochaetales bacterium]|nr:hypothetical protein [Spirochaetales bacterium]
MGKKVKLCKVVKKDILDEDLKAYLQLVGDGKFLCTKCGRVAGAEEFLCKGKRISRLLEE